MFKDLRKIHFIGIGGIGVSALAKLFLFSGGKVSGSDARSSPIVSELKNLGAEIFLGHSAANLSEDADLVVYSPAVPDDNTELLKAIDLKIPVKSYPEALGALMDGYKQKIAVSGTNGKTTTTVLVGLILEKAGRDPSVVVGGKVKEWGGNVRNGGKDYFVAEACEYKRAMLNLNPDAIILTNIEKDHLDYFKDFGDIKSAFIDYVKKIPESGLFVFNADDAASREIAWHCKAKKASYGTRRAALLAASSEEEINFSALLAENILQENGKQSFDLVYRGKNLGVFEIFVPGVFNIYNALAASLFCLELGVNAETVKETLTEFRGTWRRFEILGKTENAFVVSDYAHHPTAVRETIKGAKKFFPGKKILAVFEPHQEDRTAKLFNEFTESFFDADEIIISEIFSVKGRSETARPVSSLDIVNAIKQKSEIPVFYSPNLVETKNTVLQKAKNFDIILIMGAGDIYKIAEGLAEKTRP